MGRDCRSTRGSGASSVAFMACAAVTRLSRSRARHTHDTLTAWAAAISGADHPRSSPAIRSWRLSAGTDRPPSDPGCGEPPVDRRRRTAHEVRDRRSRPPGSVQPDQLVAVTVDPSGTTGPPVDARGDQPASHRPGRHPVALRQVVQTQPTVPIEVTDLLCGRTGASARGLRAPIDAPAGKPRVHQAGAASQLLGDLRRGVPLVDVEPDDLPVVDVRTESGRTRPARDSPSHQPVVHRLSRHPQPTRHRRERQPLIDVQPPQRLDIRAHLRPWHHQPLCHPDNPTLAWIASTGPRPPPWPQDGRRAPDHRSVRLGVHRAVVQIAGYRDPKECGVVGRFCAPLAGVRPDHLSRDVAARSPCDLDVVSTY